MNDSIPFIIQIAILIMSVVVHELSHAYTAVLLGDPTPKIQGRLTLNPIKHLDFFGSLVVPLLTSLSGFTFGWAKPVEWNPYNVKDKRVGELLISIAGPLSNILVALVFGLTLRFFYSSFDPSVLNMFAYITLINILLAVFNMIPVPPLDGSKVLFSFLPLRFSNIRNVMEMYSLPLFFVVAFIGWSFISPLVYIFFELITGI